MGPSPASERDGAFKWGRLLSLCQGEFAVAGDLNCSRTFVNKGHPFLRGGPFHQPAFLTTSVAQSTIDSSTLPIPDLGYCTGLKLLSVPQRRGCLDTLTSCLLPSFRIWGP